MTATRLHINSPQRGLRRPEAARYVGVSPTKFDEMVKDHRMPQAFNVDNCVIWDIRDLDEAFEALKAPAEDDDDGWSDVA